MCGPATTNPTWGLAAGLAGSEMFGVGGTVSTVSFVGTVTVRGGGGFASDGCLIGVNTTSVPVEGLLTSFFGVAVGAGLATSLGVAFAGFAAVKAQCHSVSVRRLCESVPLVSVLVQSAWDQVLDQLCGQARAQPLDWRSASQELRCCCWPRSLSERSLLGEKLCPTLQALD